MLVVVVDDVPVLVVVVVVGRVVVDVDVVVDVERVVVVVRGAVVVVVGFVVVVVVVGVVVVVVVVVVVMVVVVVAVVVVDVEVASWSSRLLLSSSWRWPRPERSRGLHRCPPSPIRDPTPIRARCRSAGWRSATTCAPSLSPSGTPVMR